MDEFRIDAHKLIYHPRRVADWLEGKDVYPLYIEISPCSACNHRCIFCAFDYLGHAPRFLEAAVLKRFLKDAAGKGVKSVLFSGEGETLMYRQLADMVEYACARGIDAALATNGVLLSPEISRRVIPRLTWLRVSMNAASPDTYALVHGTQPDDFEKVIANVTKAVAIKRATRSACAIGVQFLLLNENYHDAPALAGILSKIGVDYLSIKPYSQHPKSVNRLKAGLDYPKLLSIESKTRKFERPDFRIMFRKNTIARIAAGRPYKKCFGLPFAAHVTTEGELYACSAFIGDKRFSYGNINDASFEQIWNGTKRKRLMRMMALKWDIKDCREACRHDEINRYLWQLKHMPPHVNFI